MLFSRFFWFLTGRWIHNLVALVTFGIIASRIDVGDYGIYLLAATVLVFSDLFFRDIVENSIVVSKRLSREVALPACRGALLYSLLISVMALLVAMATSSLFYSALLLQLLVAFSIIVPIQALSAVYRGILIKEGKVKQLTLATVVGNVVGAVAGLVTVFAFENVWALVIQQATNNLVLLCCTFVIAKVVPKSFSGEVFKEIFVFTHKGFWASILNVTANRIDIFAASFFFGSEGAGLLGFAKRIVQITQDLLGTSLGKALVSLGQSNDTATRAARPVYLRTVLAQSIVSVPAFLGLALVADLLVPLAFGSNWSAAARLVSLMAVGGNCRTFINVELAELTTRQEMGAILRIRLVELVFAAALIFGLGNIDLIWLAAIYSFRGHLSHAFAFFANHSTSSREVLATIVAKQWPVWASTILMTAFVITLLQLGGFFSQGALLLICALVGAVSYTSLMLLLRSFWWTELFDEPPQRTGNEKRQLSTAIAKSREI